LVKDLAHDVASVRIVLALAEEVLNRLAAIGLSLGPLTNQKQVVSDLQAHNCDGVRA
jgi:hypothetical protein